jgi:DNA-binding transcriptional LysR family regulator
MSRYRDLLAEEPVPVALFDRACWWREAALKSLEARGRPYRIAFSSQSVAGVTAAVEAGIAIGLLGRSTLAGYLKVLGNEHGFASTPMSKLVIGVAASANQDLVRTMKSAIRQAF